MKNFTNKNKITKKSKYKNYTFEKVIQVYWVQKGEKIQYTFKVCLVDLDGVVLSKYLTIGSVWDFVT